MEQGLLIVAIVVLLIAWLGNRHQRRQQPDEPAEATVEEWLGHLNRVEERLTVLERLADIPSAPPLARHAADLLYAERPSPPERTPPARMPEPGLSSAAKAADAPSRSQL